jgi:hypothetical protein
LATHNVIKPVKSPILGDIVPEMPATFMISLQRQSLRDAKKKMQNQKDAHMRETKP